MGYINLGTERLFASVPTMDTERQAPFGAARNWNASHIEIFGHSVDIDIPTGNLVISTSEVAYPYYNFSLGISRKYDTQEQHMQLSYLRNYPNVDPKPHWFGNWQFAYEADVDEVWHNTYPELHVTSGAGANGLFEVKPPDFKRNLKDAGLADRLLRSYGIPRRTLAALSWEFTKNDFLLRTLRGPFQILTGHFQEETLVDSVDANIWLFNPITGSAFHITSEYFYNVPGDQYRDVGYPLTVSKSVDALGHAIELKPSATELPFREYVLSDGSGREFHIKLDEELTFLDGLNRGGKVRKYLVSKVIDGTKTIHNIFEYKYNDEHLLEKVIFPSSIGNRYVRYYYEDQNHPGVLTAIENSHGHSIQFEYMEDPTDNDERLNPRLKVKKITDSEGVTFEYEYDHLNAEVVVTISQNGTEDRKVKYHYIRDKYDTKQRFVTLMETEVRRGYTVDNQNRVVQRSDENHQVIRFQTRYSNDGRYNVERKTDALNRSLRYKYNDFNQVEEVLDFDNHRTKYIFDVPPNPSPDDPIRYDLLAIEQENLIRTVDPIDPSAFLEDETNLTRRFEYDKYDGDNSADSVDHDVQSTHRISKETDERQKDWLYTYDDPANNNPLAPTTIESPLTYKTHITYNDQGEKLTVTDPKNNLHSYEYYDQGMLKKYTDPNQRETKCFYYPCGNWLHEYRDELDNKSTLVRDPEGRLIRMLDPVQDMVDFEYYNNDRLFRLTNHRPAIPQNPDDPATFINDFADLNTEFAYSPLGKLTYLRNPKGIGVRFEHDEAGRVVHWHFDLPNSVPTKFVHDAAGHLTYLKDRKGQTTEYTYFNSGRLKSVKYPDWNNGTNSIPGKVVEYKKYDYLGQILSIVDSEIPGSKEFMYDEAGNLIMRRDPDGFELSFEYDDENRLWHLTDSSNTYELSVDLDKLGRPHFLSDSPALDGSLSWEYQYTKQVGPVTKVLNLYERLLPNIGLRTEFDYDDRDLLTHIRHSRSGPPPSPFFSQNYVYREDGLLERITGDDPNEFRYDGLKQLIYEDAGNLSADYDETGNRLYRTDRQAVPNPVHNSYNQKNQLITIGDLDSQITYDENGNVRTSPLPVDLTTFYFDGNNLLRRVKNAQYEIDYLYDHEGKLVERVFRDSASVERTRFYYSQSRPVIIEKTGSPPMVLTWDMNGDLLRIRKQDVTGSASHLHSIFPLYDGYLNLARVVDADGNEVAGITRDAWGGVTNWSGQTGLADFIGYRNAYYDEVTGYLLFGARWYHPVMGRWIPEDPSISGGNRRHRDLNNLYCYASNNPVNRFDSTGLADKDISEETKADFRLCHGVKANLLDLDLGINLEFKLNHERFLLKTSAGLGPLKGAAAFGGGEGKTISELEAGFGIGKIGPMYVGKWVGGQRVPAEQKFKLLGAVVGFFGMNIGAEFELRRKEQESVLFEEPLILHGNIYMLIWNVQPRINLTNLFDTIISSSN